MKFTLPLSYYWKLITTRADDAFQPGESWNDVGEGAMFLRGRHAAWIRDGNFREREVPTDVNP